MVVEVSIQSWPTAWGPVVRKRFMVGQVAEDTFYLMSVRKQRGRKGLRS